MKRLPPHICKLLDELDHLFGLSNYDWYTYIEEKDEEDSRGRKRSASIDIDEEYQRIYVHFYPCFFKSHLKHQRGYILHEFCHTVTHELTEMCISLLDGRLITKDQVRGANERATSEIANLLDGLLQTSNKKARQAYANYPKRKVVKKKRLHRRK